MNLRFWGCDPLRDHPWVVELIEAGRLESVDIAVEYVDVLASVNSAVLNNVIVTPTLDRLDPLPFARLIAIGADFSMVMERLGGSDGNGPS
jgi:hypothetical protein